MGGMKLRIQGNSLRLRVTQPELARLVEGREVADVIHLGPAVGASLRYTLTIADQAAPVEVAYQEGAIAVSITPEQLRAWTDESAVGIYATLEIGPGGLLDVAVEKDFKCLDIRGEQDKDAFPNPLVGKVC